MCRREAPAGIIPIIINLGPAYRPDRSHRGTRPRYVGSFVAGLHESFALTESGGFAICVQVNLNPLGAYQLLGVPMHTLANCAIELEDVLGIAARRLASQMQDAALWETRFAILDSFIIERIARGRPPSPEIAWAWRHLNQTGGLASVGTLASEINCSHKHLIEQFRRQIGLPPKTLAQDHSFQSRRRAAQSKRRRSLGPDRRPLRILRPGTPDQRLSRVRRQHAR